MLLDPVLKVICDGCQAEEEVGLTPIARGGYDERNVEHAIKDLGWMVAGDEHFCEWCVEDGQAQVLEPGLRGVK